jgi:hypothetical protein
MSTIPFFAKWITGTIGSIARNIKPTNISIGGFRSPEPIGDHKENNTVTIVAIIGGDNTFEIRSGMSRLGLDKEIPLKDYS